MGDADPQRDVIMGDGTVVSCGTFRVVVGTVVVLPPPVVIVSVGRSPGIVWVEQDRSDDDAG